MLEERERKVILDNKTNDFKSYPLPPPLALSPLIHIFSESVVRALAFIAHYLGPKQNHLMHFQSCQHWSGRNQPG